MLKVTLLGTGGTQPLPDRALAAAAVTVGGRSVLLDCGEGTQVGLRRYGVSAYRLSAVLLTTTATTCWSCPVFCRPWAA